MHNYRRSRTGLPSMWGFLALPALALSWFGALAASVPDNGSQFVLQSHKPFDEVMADLKIAISENNYRITGENLIGDALTERHGRPFPRSSVVHFCNLEHARQILAKAPDLLLQMPCRVAVYEHDGDVIVAAPLLPADPRVTKLVDTVNDILRAIVTDAAQ